jgi:hypothetical protein
VRHNKTEGCNAAVPLGDDDYAAISKFFKNCSSEIFGAL